MTREEGISRVYQGPGHVVILGAGASIASTLRDPEPSGKSLPSMDDFIDVLHLGDLVSSFDREADGNFEAVYSRIHESDPESPVLGEIEARVSEYFRGMGLPPTPTVYDYLMCSLRPKDLIATYNWDPFLFQAFCRNRRVGGLPHLSFLHGSVAVGYSLDEHKAGPSGAFADPACAHEFAPTRLLYPVKQKDYNVDEFTRHEWERLKYWLKNSKRITVFGYGAPDTDVEAVALMSAAWGTPAERNLEQTEIIDVQPESILTTRWAPFIHSHHYDCVADYFQSSLSQFPRRTGERFMHQYLPSSEAEAFQEPNPVPQDFSTLDALWEWHAPLVCAEKIFEDGAL